jgi:hypothetical protein
MVYRRLLKNEDSKMTSVEMLALNLHRSNIKIEV